MNYYLTTSGLKTADAAIAARGALLHAVTLVPAAADCSVVLYDNASAASGTVLSKVSGIANTGSITIAFNHPICANSGIYADISGASAGYIIHYSLA